jgi:hypothetical protein
MPKIIYLYVDLQFLCLVRFVVCDRDHIRIRLSRGDIGNTYPEQDTVRQNDSFPDGSHRHRLHSLFYYCLVHQIPLPPSTSIQAPVRRLASSLASHAAVFPISAGSANRPKGIVLIILARLSGESSPPRKNGTLHVNLALDFL